MATIHRDRSTFPSRAYARTIPLSGMILAVLALLATSLAQQQPPTVTEPDSQANSPVTAKPETPEQDEAPVTIPAGTRLALVLTHPVDSKTMHRGDQIYAQTTAPVAVGDQVVIPAGTFVQGQMEKLTRHGSRGELLMQSLSVLFPNGYVAHLTGPLNIESDEGTAWNNPGSGAKVGAIVAPMAGLGLGAMAGSFAHTTQSSTLGGTTITSSTPKGLAIGSVVGLAAGGVVALVLLTHSRQFFVEIGSPMELNLSQPLTLAENQVIDAVRQAQSQPPTVTPIAPRPLPSFPTDHGTCYTPDTPGTPPTIIPGTPAIGDSPGTPDTVTPGTPSIPGTPYPCP
jgi:type IV secretion system protein VirB10